MSRLLILLSLAILSIAPSRAESTTETLLAKINAGESRTEIPSPAGEATELWILAGQSNMVGRGFVREHPEPDPRIWAFRMDNEWKLAQDPLHLLGESIFGAHRKITQWTPEKQAQIMGEVWNRPATMVQRGTGPGMSFARGIVDEVAKPIGLIVTAHGGTSMAQWDPALKSEGTDSLYGAMLERVKLARAGGKGGTLRGMIWYQGESDTNSKAVKLKDDGTSETVGEAFERQWLGFVDSVRADLGEPELPILYVQLSRLTILDQDRAPDWEAVREAQRRAAEMRSALYVVPAIDLPLEDVVHISYEGQQRLGKRLAEVALSQVYRKPDHATPIELESIQVLPPDPNLMSGGFRIKVKYKGVNGKLRCEGRPAGFSLRREPIEGRLGNNINRVDLDPLDPCTVTLSGRMPWVEGTQLIYAPGLDPYVNITDERDMALPAFGPMPVAAPEAL